MSNVIRRLTELKLTPFRSHSSFHLRTEGASVALVGPNGAGKTNVLEAASLLTPGRGIRRAALDDMVPVGADGFVVAAVLHDEVADTRIATATKRLPESGLRRFVRIDGRDTASSEDLLDHLRVLWTTPDIEREFMEAKVSRRAFLDRFAMAMDPRHARRCADMERTLRTRSSLLAQRASASRIDGLDRVLAPIFAGVHLARVHAVASLQEEIDARVDSDFPKADLKLDSGWEEGLVDGEAEAAALDVLRRRRPAHLASGRTTEGPHRADLRAVHREKGLDAALCSTGERKALVVGMMLAQASALKRGHDVEPLLLLDEVSSHLDDRRRGSLFASLETMGCQTLYTGTDEGAFAAAGLKIVKMD